MAVNLGADLQRLTRVIEPGRLCMQHAADVAQAHDTLPIEQMRVDARHLRCDIGPYTEQAAGELIHELEGAQIEIVPGAGQQRLEIFEQRRHYQLIPVYTE